MGGGGKVVQSGGGVGGDGEGVEDQRGYFEQGRFHSAKGLRHGLCLAGTSSGY